MPLTELSPNDPTTIEAFECCINGQEISPVLRSNTACLRRAASA
jgi:hypothetical protein